MPRAGAEGSISIGLVGTPASPQDPRAAFYVVDHVAAGDTIERTVRVQNGGGAPIELDLYAGGSSVVDDRLQFADRAGDHSDLAEWTTVTPDHVALGPGTATDATVRVAVPDGARTGERLGVVWAQSPASGEGTAVVNRVGVRMYVTVGDGEPPVTDLRVDTLTAARDASGAPRLELAVSNTGRREIEPSGTVTVAGTAVPISPGLALLPGADGVVSAALPPGTSGSIAVVATITANGVDRRVDATVSLPDRAGTRGDPVAVARHGGGGDRTGPALASVLLAVLALTGGWRTRKRLSAD